MKKNKPIIIFLLLLISLNSFSQVLCDGSDATFAIPVQLNYDNIGCSFSLTATSSRINNICNTPSSPCRLSPPCYGFCYEWRLFLGTTQIAEDCTIENTNTFTGLTSDGTYRIFIIYKRLFSCSGGLCDILLDKGLKTKGLVCRVGKLVKFLKFSTQHLTFLISLSLCPSERCFTQNLFWS